MKRLLSGLAAVTFVILGVFAGGNMTVEPIQFFDLEIRDSSATTVQQRFDFVRGDGGCKKDRVRSFTGRL